MDTLDKLIEELKKTREELNKGTNMSMDGAPNMSSGNTAMKAEGRKDMGDGRTVQGDNPSPEAVETELEHNIMSGIKKDEDCSVVKNGDEYFKLFKNGQWHVEKSAKVMPLTPDLKSSPKADAKGKPYDGSQDKKNL